MFVFSPDVFDLSLSDSCLQENEETTENGINPELAKVSYTYSSHDPVSIIRQYASKYVIKHWWRRVLMTRSAACCIYDSEGHKHPYCAHPCPSSCASTPDDSNA